jgi:hypothetical protein
MYTDNGELKGPFCGAFIGMVAGLMWPIVLVGGPIYIPTVYLLAKRRERLNRENHRLDTITAELAKLSGGLNRETQRLDTAIAELAKRVDQPVTVELPHAIAAKLKALSVVSNSLGNPKNKVYTLNHHPNQGKQ